MRYLTINFWGNTKKTSQDSKRLPRVHLMGCWGVKWFLLKGFFLCFWNWAMSEFEFFSCVKIWVLNLVTIWVFEFYHNLRFGVLLLFQFLSFVPIWVVAFWDFELRHNLSTWVLSLVDFFLSFVTIWVFEFRPCFCFYHTFIFVTIWFFSVLS